MDSEPEIVLPNVEILADIPDEKKAEPGESADVSNVEATLLDDGSAEAKRKFFTNLVACAYHDIFLHQGDQPFLNDVEIHCADGLLRAPSLLLASVSPLFRATAPVADIVESPSLVLPDLSKTQLETFFAHLCEIDGDSAVHEMDTINMVMEVLCAPFQGSDDPVDSLFLLDQVWPANVDVGAPKRSQEDNKENVVQQPKKRVGRKPGQKLNVKQEPYVKTEVTDSHRTSAVYGLRKTVKRKKFTDEISDPSDLDDDEDEVDEFMDDSADEYAPDEAEHNSLEEESESDEDIEDELLEDDEEDDGGMVNEDDLFDSDDEIIDASIDVKTSSRIKDLESFTVKVAPDGSVEVLGADEVASPVKTKTRGRPRKRPRLEGTELIGIGRVVSIMEDEDPGQLAFKGKKIYAAAKSDPRSLLKPSGGGPLPLILFCSQCEEQCNSQAELKHHVAKAHKGSKFFTLPRNNPHRDCVQCSTLMASYESTVADVDPNEQNLSDICFPCPHCRRRYVGYLGGLNNHLINDHRNAIATELGDKAEEYFAVLQRDDAKVLACDFCTKSFPHTTALNKHLISCSENDSGCSAGLFCHICGKMFAQQRYLKDHLRRHGKDQVNRPRNFVCGFCPVTCISDANLQKHIDREHSSKDPDLDFVLHEGCERCSAMLASYMENKATGAISFRDMVFKCPHCCMVLYANHKHAPRYLHNHIHKFHTDPEINDFTLGGNDPSEFRLRSKLENDVLTCEFCGFASKTRANHNVHLSTCKQSTVPCRPGYMCDTCGFIAGTAVHLRNHLESHNDPKTYECEQCNYTGRSKRYLLSHIKNHHTEEGQRKRLEAARVACPKCGKLKKEGPPYKSHIKKCGSGPPRVHCPECDMEFKRREDMQAHALIHYGQVTCPIHNILFKQESEVFQHVNVAEPEDKFPKLQCCMCEKSFRHMCIFMKHMRRHLRISPYRCSICQKHVNTYASLALHMKRMHSNEKADETLPKEKSHKCEQCGKMFGSKGHLNEHILGVHDRSSVTNCPVCHKSFNTAKRMKKHLFNAHKDTAETFKDAWKSTEPFATIAIKFNQI